MNLIYNIAIYFFGLGISLAALFGNEKAKKWKRGRNELFNSLGQKLDGNKLPVVWFHVSSLGEFEMAKPLIEKLRKGNAYQLVVSFFSPSGFENVNEKKEGIIKTYVPLDMRKRANKFIDLLNPNKAIFVKNDLWVNHLKLLEEKGIECHLISADFRENQVYFKWYGALFRKVLSGFKTILVQNSSAVDLVQNKGISDVHFSGDIRMDRTLSIKNEQKEIAFLNRFLDGRFCLVLGSSWEKEVELARQYYQVKKEEVQLIIAPHDVSSKNISILKNQFEGALLYSELNEHSNDGDVLIIDGIGLLKYLYKYADLAFVGGAWGKGLHNILEAAVYGIPVVFGPNTKNYPEAQDLLSFGGAKQVTAQTDFNAFLNECLSNKSLRNEIGNKAALFVEQNKGALQKTYDLIFA